MGCDSAKIQLIKCLQASDCTKRRSGKECLLKEHRPAECEESYMAFFHCKRAMIDPRFRFKGNVFE